MTITRIYKAAAVIRDIFCNIVRRIRCFSAAARNCTRVYFKRNAATDKNIGSRPPSTDICGCFRRKEAVGIIELCHKIKVTYQIGMCFFRNIRDKLIIRLAVFVERSAEKSVHGFALTLRSVVNRNKFAAELEIMHGAYYKIICVKINIFGKIISFQAEVNANFAAILFTQTLYLFNVLQSAILGHTVRAVEKRVRMP